MLLIPSACCTVNNIMLSDGMIFQALPVQEALEVHVALNLRKNVTFHTHALISLLFVCVLVMFSF